MMAEQNDKLRMRNASKKLKAATTNSVVTAPLFTDSCNKPTQHVTYNIRRFILNGASTSFMFVLLIFTLTGNCVYNRNISLLNINEIDRIGTDVHLQSPSPFPSKTCVITISAMNNFGFVLNLYDSIIKNSPSIDCFVWFMGDNPNPIFESAADGLKEIKDTISTQKDKFSKFTFVDMKEMNDELPSFDGPKLAFIYDLVELQTTMKPFAFQYAFQKLDATAVLYLDNDIWVTDSLAEIQRHLTTRSVVLTPHYSNPVPEDGKNQNDRNVVGSGVFNFGFVAFSKSLPTERYLDWWGEKLTLYGFANIEQSMFYDQNWGMFIPAFFDHEDYYVIRDLRYNIAYWNLHERGTGLQLKNGLPYLKNPDSKLDERVVFMHFSGMSLLEKYDNEGISRHQNRYTLSDLPHLAAIFKAYSELISHHNTLHYRALPYGYNHYTDGTQIEQWMRDLYAAAVVPVPKGDLSVNPNQPLKVAVDPFLRHWFQNNVNPNPFCKSSLCKDQSKTTLFYDWSWEVTPDFAIDMKGMFYWTVFHRELWGSRVDLQLKFEDPVGQDYFSFQRWFSRKMASNDESVIPKSMLDQLSKQMTKHKQNHNNYHNLLSSEKDESIGLNIIGWHAGKFSIGISGAKIISAALTANIPVNAVELGMSTVNKFKHPNELYFPLTRSISHPINILIMNADSHPPKDIPSVVWENKYNIGYWTWELDVLKPEWIKKLKDFDQVWCPSLFVKRSIENSPTYDGTPIQVLPIPIQPAKVLQTREIQSDLLQTVFDGHKKTNPFVFLVVFDFHSYVQRKNPEASIRAFLDAFPAKDDVEMKYQLIVKTHYGSTRDIENLRKVANNDPRVVFINELLADSDLKALYKRQDCFISLHRSEGYGMNILETLYYGIPVITTDYSGNTAFFKPLDDLVMTCVFPVLYKLVQLEETYGPYEAGNHWAEPNHGDAVKAMRTVVANDCKKIHGKTLTSLVEKAYGTEAVGRKIKQMLIDLTPLAFKKQEKIRKKYGY